MPVPNALSAWAPGNLSPCKTLRALNDAAAVRSLRDAPYAVRYAAWTASSDNASAIVAVWRTRPFSMMTTRSATRPAKYRFCSERRMVTPCGLELFDRGGHLLHDDRRQSLRRLVEQDRPRVSHQRTRHRQHLALASGQRACPLATSFRQVGEQLEEPFGRPGRHAFPRRLAGDVEVLRNRQPGEDATILGHVAQPALAHLERLETGDRLPVEPDLAAGGTHEPHDALERGRLPRAVAPEQRHHLARGDVERHVGQDLRPAVVGVDPGDLKHRRSPEPIRVDFPPPGRSPAPTDRHVPPRARPRQSAPPGSGRRCGSRA